MKSLYSFKLINQGSYFLVGMGGGGRVWWGRRGTSKNDFQAKIDFLCTLFIIKLYGLLKVKKAKHMQNISKRLQTRL